MTFLLGPGKYLVGIIAMLLALGGAYYYGRVDGKNSCAVPVLQQAIKEAKKDAQDWANKPVGHDALVKRLRDAASKLPAN